MRPPDAPRSVLERYPTLELPRRAWRRRRWDADTLSGVLGGFSFIVGFGMILRTDFVELTVIRLGLALPTLPEFWGFVAFILSGLLLRSNSRLRIAVQIVSMFYWASVTASLFIVRPLEPYLATWFALALTLLAALTFQRSVASFLERRRE
ncbi:MAG: hypothetical protein HC933_16090 [Pleurocapsa sp. SU_196_0]|nr:hypothetical protein [Pleurocapsa sp. SU_196_0]